MSIRTDSETAQEEDAMKTINKIAIGGVAAGVAGMAAGVGMILAGRSASISALSVSVNERTILAGVPPSLRRGGARTARCPSPP